MIDLAKRKDVLTILKNPSKYPANSKDRNWALAYTEEAFGLLQPTPANLTPQQMVDAAIAAAKNGDVINFGAGDFSATIHK